MRWTAATLRCVTLSPVIPFSSAGSVGLCLSVVVVAEGVGTVVCVAINRGDTEVRLPYLFLPLLFCQLVSGCRCCCYMWHAMKCGGAEVRLPYLFLLRLLPAGVYLPLLSLAPCGPLCHRRRLNKTLCHPG
jgi:hypothetical protein